jgi:hypothetical protein
MNIHIWYEIKIINNKDDVSQMKRFKIGDQSYNLYRFLRVKTLKRIIIFENNVNEQWPSLHDVVMEGISMIWLRSMA